MQSSGNKTFDSSGKITDSGQMIELSHLLELFDEYQRATGLAESTISKRVFNDGKKLASLRADNDISTKRFNVTFQWLSDNWPEGAKWPAKINRPYPSNLERVA